MRSKGLWMLLIAVLAGLVAVLLAAKWMQQQKGSQGSIAVANVEIDLGSRISPEMVRMVDWPQNSVPPGAIVEAAKLEGRVVIGSVQRGEPILESKLAPVGTKGGLSAVVPEGKRAMTVRVNDVVGVAGFALPGTFVDVMVNTQEDSTQRGDRDLTISKIVLERILVLAVAQEANRDETKPKVVNAVTLEVTPPQAETLDLARSVGTLSLVLRNQAESGAVGTVGVTKAVLFASRNPPAPPPAAPAPAPKPVVQRVVLARPVSAPSPERACVDVIRGLTKITECF